MSPRVPAFKPRKAIQTFKNAGFRLDHIEGSHYYFTLPADPSILFSVPYHSGELKRSTLAKLLKRAKLTVEEFLRHDP